MVKLTEEQLKSKIQLSNEILTTQIDNLKKFINDFQNLELNELLVIFKLIDEQFYILSDVEVNLEDYFKFKLSIADIITETKAVDILTSILQELFDLVIWTDHSNELDEINFKLISWILLIFVNYSDINSKCGQEICKSDQLLDLIYKLICTFKERVLNKTITVTQTYGLNWGITTIYNTLIYEDNENLNKISEKNFLPLIVNCMKYLEGNARIIALLLIAYLSNESESQEFKSDSHLISELIDLLNNSMKSKIERYNDVSTSELSKGIEKLSKNDDNKQLLIDLGILPVLKNLINLDSTDHKKTALSILWSLAFDDQNKAIIKEEFSSHLSKMKNWFNVTGGKSKNIISKDEIQAFDECKKIFQGLVWTLNGREEYCEIARSPTNEKHIMISYNWTYSDLILKIYNKLKSDHHKLWFDRVNMTDVENIMESMAQAVENSLAVIICISQHYRDSENCRSEASYARKRKVPIIPILVQEKYRPDGWLKFCRNNPYYCDFTDRHSFTENYFSLNKQIDRIKYERESQNTRGIDNLYSSLTSDELQSIFNAPSYVKDWTNSQTTSWFKDIGIERIKWKPDYTGLELEFLRIVSRVSGESFYRICEKKLEITDLKDLRILFQNLHDL